MHELSVAMSLVDVVVERLIASGGGRVGRVVVEVGDLSGVVPRQLASACAVAARGEPGLASATLLVRPVAVAVDCPACGEAPAVAAAELRCVHCGRASPRVVRGRELDVVSIEVFDAAETA